MFTLCPLFSILLRIFTAIDDSINFELLPQFFLQVCSFLHVRGPELSTYIFCTYLPLHHTLQPFEFYIQSLIHDLKKVNEPFIFYMHLCDSIYNFLSVILECSYAYLQLENWLIIYRIITFWGLKTIKKILIHSTTYCYFISYSFMH